MGIGMGIGMGPRMKMRDGRLGRSLRFGGGNSFTWFDGDGYGLLFLFFFFFWNFYDTNGVNDNDELNFNNHNI